MVRPLSPAARDAAAARVVKITTGVVAAGVAATLGLGATIAYTAPAPKSGGGKADYDDKSKKSKPAKKNTQGDDRPESSSGDEDTTSGGS
ncbi:hypothetical protein [Alloactinosynnema sp. L-07]|uniref:hypothetical protein n=1 Tax=Alloactinosynnema sp. L-07 TaxID=1653480 RepID=UPI00065F08AB|nr:hypothetical protein [Alloactinosynnema sp. L-07]CRK60741.1 hypothetical protein [Alloactinosynnema sp. L-07]